MLHTALIYHEELARLRHEDVLREGRELHAADAVRRKTPRAAGKPRRKHAPHRHATAH
jgi:hypothetical protein